MPSKSKRLRVIAGPNGSGKSTIFNAINLQYYTGPFINADEIEYELKVNGEIDPFKLFQMEMDPGSLARFLKGKGASWVEKAISEEGQISLKYLRGKIVTAGKSSPYDAALCADFIRNQLLKQQSTFTFETVLSHSSKIDFLKVSQEAGYKNYIYFVCTIDPAINIKRVALRVKQGGHSVTKSRIIKRYRESLEMLSKIIPYCYSIYFFDNSSETPCVDPIAEIDNSGQLKFYTEDLPWWMDEYVIKKLS